MIVNLLGKTFTIDVALANKVDSLFKSIRQKEGITSKIYLLIFDGKPVCRETSLAQQGLSAGATLRMIPKLKGGSRDNHDSRSASSNPRHPILQRTIDSGRLAIQSRTTARIQQIMESSDVDSENASSEVGGIAIPPNLPPTPSTPEHSPPSRTDDPDFSSLTDSVLDGMMVQFFIDEIMQQDIPPVFIVVLNDTQYQGQSLRGIHVVFLPNPNWSPAVDMLWWGGLDFAVLRDLSTART
jgi:hypothetical protein